MFARNALVFSLLMTSGLASAAEFNTAKLSETQLKSAGVTTMTVPTTPTGNDGKSLARNNVMLSGRVTIPNSRQARVVATLAGQVQSILVNIGEPVRNGTPLLRIYSTELLGVQRDYLHARSASIVSEQKFKRDQSLYEDGIISLGRLEETRQAQQQDATNLQEQRQLLKLAGLSNVGIAKLVDATAISPMMTINSPLNGVALEQTITPGMRVSAGDELFLVADINTLWIEAQATAAQLDQLAIGNIVHVSSCSKPGRVAAISPIIARDNQTGLVRIEITPVKQCLRPNQFTEVTITTNAAVSGNSIAVPASALFTQDGINFVFIQNTQGFVQQQVSVQSREGDTVWIKSTLPAGTVLATAGIAAIRGAVIGLGVPE